MSTLVRSVLSSVNETLPHARLPLYRSLRFRRSQQGEGMKLQIFRRIISIIMGSLLLSPAFCTPLWSTVPGDRKSINNIFLHTVSRELGIRTWSQTFFSALCTTFLLICICTTYFCYQAICQRAKDVLINLAAFSSTVDHYHRIFDWKSSSWQPPVFDRVKSRVSCAYRMAVSRKFLIAIRWARRGKVQFNDKINSLRNFKHNRKRAAFDRA